MRIFANPQRTWGVIQGDCIEKMKLLRTNSIDAVVCDPPYGIAFMGKSWDAMGPREFQTFSEAWAAEALRVLKPGGYLLAFAGSRTYHRMVCGIEDAGFTIRDSLQWIYGSGFPKSSNIAKAIDAKIVAGRTDSVGLKATTAVRPGKSKTRSSRQNGIIGSEAETVVNHNLITPEAVKWNGYGSALKPAHEPIVLARKPLIGTLVDNVLAYGTGALNIDGGRVSSVQTKQKTSTRKAHDEFGTFCEKAGGKRTTGSGATNVKGRWPANVIHDGSPEVLAGFPQSSGGAYPAHGAQFGYSGGERKQTGIRVEKSDSGSAARFFYCAKVSRAEREYGLDHMAKASGEWFNTANGTSDKPSSIAASRPARAERANNHPTVKPVDLMRYLITLVTQPGGTVLDPFSGSGSTGVAAVGNGFQFVGIEQDPDYARIATARISAAELEQPDDLPSVFGDGLFK